jgi:hypothetical protein
MPFYLPYQTTASLSIPPCIPLPHTQHIAVLGVGLPWWQVLQDCPCIPDHPAPPATTVALQLAGGVQGQLPGTRIIHDGPRQQQPASGNWATVPPSAAEGCWLPFALLP